LRHGQNHCIGIKFFFFLPFHQQERPDFSSTIKNRWILLIYAILLLTLGVHIQTGFIIHLFWRILCLVLMLLFCAEQCEHTLDQLFWKRFLTKQNRTCVWKMLLVLFWIYRSGLLSSTQTKQTCELAYSFFWNADCVLRFLGDHVTGWTAMPKKRK